MSKYGPLDPALRALQVHHCVFHWIKGHDRTKENIRCDELASRVGKKPRRAVDHGYEKTRRLSQNLLLPQLPDAFGGSKR